MNEINVIHHMNELRNIFSYASNIGFSLAQVLLARLGYLI